MLSPEIKRRKPLSEEARKKISEANKGQKAWNKGMPAPWARKRMLERNPMKEEVNRERMRKNNPMSHEGEVAYKRPDYKRIHYWVIKTLGRPKQCEHCKEIIENPRKINWANISREYKKDVTDWKRLCKKCHCIFDKQQVGKK